MKKFDIINGLARQYGFTRYLEICTTTTGRRFDFVQPVPLTTRHRLVYQCPETYEDGIPITFRTANEYSYELIRAIAAALTDEARYDIILVDPYHGYDSSLLDLRGAMCLLRPGGVLVVHDCNPRDERTVGPTFQPGDWCGQTYQAFVDFALATRTAGYCTVDADFGCGVIYTETTALPEQWSGYRPAEQLAFGWTIAWHAGRSGFEFFRQHRQALLNIVSAEDFANAHPDVAQVLRENAERIEPLPTAREPQAAATAEAEPSPPLNGHAAMDDDDAASQPVTTDPGLHLWVDGLRIDPIRVEEGSWTFDVSGHERPLYLVSRACRPSDLGLSSDSRTLGVRVHAITAEADERTVTVTANRGAFDDGFYDVEHDLQGSYWRWTNGRALLPPYLWEALPQPETLTVMGRAMTKYIDARRGDDHARHV